MRFPPLALNHQKTHSGNSLQRMTEPACLEGGFCLFTGRFCLNLWETVPCYSTVICSALTTGSGAPKALQVTVITVPAAASLAIFT